MHGRRQAPVRLIGRLIPDTRVLALGVVPVKVFGNIASGLTHRVKRTKIHALVLNGAPEPLDEDVVTPCTPTVHRERRAPPSHRWHGMGELARSELTTLIGDDDFRGAELGKRLLNDLDGVAGFKRRRGHVRQHPAAGYIDHGG